MATSCLWTSQPLGSVLPTFQYMMLSVPPHVQEPLCIHAKVAVGPWWSLAICSPAPASEISLVQTCRTQQPPSWTVSGLGLSPSPTQELTAAPFPWDTLSQDCGTWPTFLWAEERWGGVPIEYFSPDLCPTFLFGLLVSCSAAGSLLFPRTGHIAPSFSPMTLIPSPASPSLGSPEIFLSHPLYFASVLSKVPLSRKTMAGHPPSSHDQKAHQTHEGISILMDERKKK